ncbi:hypothetical protein VOI54_17820 [Tamlana sp. 2201CG12-4]|uniref:hypothetical protein n=1 Tax=Tamlana sp. 2201CG12-4 TaxID=3112582 RepID=UPI002DB6AF0E|nr:hypothetical protein [Tamlana sp. 2201CG12-4]MEC3908890.1 hypothetical protein [Tamlana sp. 2201CG12-4]
MENPKTLQLDFDFEINTIPKAEIKPINVKKAKEDFVFDFMDSLTSPIIVFKSAWQDAVPANVLNKITMSRVLCKMKGEQMASLTEVVAYMMPRTFEAPMPSEWVNIYTWCGLQHTNLFNNSGQKRDMVSAMQEIAPNKLSDYEQGLLKHLRLWIYDKRRKALKASLKNAKQRTPESSIIKQRNIFS